MNELFTHKWTPRFFAGLVGVSALFVGTLFVREAKSLRYVGQDYLGQRTITVSGTGETTAVPDIAEFTFSIFEESKELASAQKTATEKANAAIAFLRESDIAKDDIKTVHYNIGPRYEFRGRGQVICAVYPCPPPPIDAERVLVGYEVVQTILVKVRDTEAVGALLAGVGSLGASNVSGVVFTVDDEEKFQSEAREEAVKKARAEAKRIAVALGVRLGRVTSFSEYGGITPFYREKAYFDAAIGAPAAVPAPELPAGTNTFSTTVTVTYELR